MLLGTRRQVSESEVEATYGSVHNYYESKVFEEIYNKSDHAKQDSNFLADVACVALNRLPPKYVRHDVDLTFFLSPDEMEQMRLKVSTAVQEALDYVISRSPPASKEATKDGSSKTS